MTITSPIVLCHDIHIIITKEYLKSIIDTFTLEFTCTFYFESTFIKKNSIIYEYARQELADYLEVFPTMKQTVLRWLEKGIQDERVEREAHLQSWGQHMLDVRNGNQKKNHRIDSQLWGAYELAHAKEQCL